MKRTVLLCAALAATLLSGSTAYATRFKGLQAIDKETLVVMFQDGDVRYRDNGTGPSAFLGHTFVDGDDTLVVFSPRLDPAATGWTVTSADDPSFGTVSVTPCRKSKPMHWDHTLTAELDHWLYLRLPKPMKEGCTYTVNIPAASGSDTESAQIQYSAWLSFSEAVHVNILGYSTQEERKAADLYMWLGDGGARDYKAYEGKAVWLLNLVTGQAVKTGEVRFWKPASDSRNEAGRKDLTGSDVWNIDFTCSEPGRYCLVVEDVGRSMAFDIRDNIYFEPYRYSVRGYYYMRLQEPADPKHVWPVPRQPQFTPGVDPEGFVVYKTDLHPWHPDWRKLRGDVWDEHLPFQFEGEVLELVGEDDVAAFAGLAFAGTGAGEFQAAVIDGPAGRKFLLSVTAPSLRGGAVEEDDIAFVIDLEIVQVHLGGIDDRVFGDGGRSRLLLSLVAAGNDGDHQCSSRCKQKDLFHGLYRYLRF